MRINSGIRLVEYQNQREVVACEYEEAVKVRDGQRAEILKQMLNKIDEAIGRLMYGKRG